MPSDNIPSLPKSTPMGTQPIESFVVKLRNGRSFQILVEDGDGFFREEFFVGKTKSFRTFQAYVANGKILEIPSFRTPLEKEFNSDTRLQLCQG